MVLLEVRIWPALLYYGSAQHFVAVVEHYRLTGSNAELGLIESYPQLIMQNNNFNCKFPGFMTYFRSNIRILVWCGTTDPTDISRG